MPCQVDPPSKSEAEYIAINLCYACRFMTKQQMWNSPSVDGYINLWMWYTEHLLTDASNALRDGDKDEWERIVSEGLRVGLKIENDQEYTGNISSTWIKGFNTGETEMTQEPQVAVNEEQHKRDLACAHVMSKLNNIGALLNFIRMDTRKDSESYHSLITGISLKFNDLTNDINDFIESAQ